MSMSRKLEHIFVLALAPLQARAVPHTPGGTQSSSNHQSDQNVASSDPKPAASTSQDSTSNTTDQGPGRQAETSDVDGGEVVEFLPTQPNAPYSVPNLGLANLPPDSDDEDEASRKEWFRKYLESGDYERNGPGTFGTLEETVYGQQSQSQKNPEKE